MASIIQIRRDLAANWTAANPTLASGEMGLEIDTLKVKFGDGATAWALLNYFDAGLQPAIDSKAPLASPTFTGIVTLPATTVINLVNDTTPQLGGGLDCNGQTIDKQSFKQIADASLGTGTHVFDYSLGSMQQLTATGNISIAFSNFPAGQVCSMIIDAVNWGAFTITPPLGLVYDSATPPIFSPSGTDRLVILKDKVDIYSMFIVGQGIA